MTPYHIDKQLNKQTTEKSCRQQIGRRIFIRRQSIMHNFHIFQLVCPSHLLKFPSHRISSDEYFLLSVSCIVLSVSVSVALNSCVSIQPFNAPLVTHVTLQLMWVFPLAKVHVGTLRLNLRQCEMCDDDSNADQAHTFQHLEITRHINM